jgi:hypothetical protein
MIVMLGVWFGRIEGVRETRSFGRRLIFRIEILSPAFAFQVEIGRRKKLAQARASAIRTLAQGVLADFLQHIESMVAGIAFVIKDRQRLVS